VLRPGPTASSVFPNAGVHYPCYLSNTQKEKGAMGEQFLDDLARSLDGGTISRTRALKVVGGALLGAVVPPLFPREAEARVSFRRKCRRKGGTVVSPTASSGCRCAQKCTTGHVIYCNSAKSCVCIKTIDGEGFCASSTDGPCTSHADCTAVLGPDARCIPQCDTGFTFCARPCTTP